MHPSQTDTSGWEDGDPVLFPNELWLRFLMEKGEDGCGPRRFRLQTAVLY